MSEERIAIIDGCLYNEKTGEVCMQARFVQELVRCKDCINWWSEERQCKDEMGFARHWNADDYCSYGKRREG